MGFLRSGLVDGAPDPLDLPVRRLAEAATAGPPSSDFRSSSRAAPQAARSRRGGRELSAPPPLSRSATGVARRLRREFQAALRGATRQRRCVFLELFAGSAGVGRQLRQAGYAVVSLDIQMGVRGNVLLRVVERLLKGWISSGAVLGVWLGTPCII